MGISGNGLYFNVIGERERNPLVLSNGKWVIFIQFVIRILVL